MKQVNVKVVMLAVLMSMVGMDAMAYEIEFNGIWYDLNRQWEAYVSNGSGFNIQAHYSGDVTIPDYVINNGSLYEVVGIKSEAFTYSPDLSHVTIPNTVTYIGDRAFSGCRSLHSIVIPNSVTYIGPVPFISCEYITSIVVADGNPKYDSRDGCNAIIETATNSLVQGCKNSTIPNSVTSIGNSAFGGYSGLTSIEIPNSVTSIGNGAFSGCGLTSVTIPNSVTIIGDGAFANCNVLTSVTIPSSVTSIGSGAFSGCKLSEVYCYAEKVPEIHSMAFWGSNSANATLYVPAGSVEAYKSTAPWNKFKQILPIGSTGINNNVADYKEKAADIYTLDSKKVPSLREGVNIVRMSDGTTRKVIGK